MNNVKRSAWYCPSCQSMHAPHCDTCPNPADAIATKTMPQHASIGPTRADCIARFEMANFAGYDGKFAALVA
ncbi:hypothetical protein [Mesorhizobium sp.]|uniref:hypothetical protein n=1 Tax=Mesorhizobium sp. TaxID=1871066 RepID=UPI0012192DE6|nr:hypothetical protein [Mesorhizobium sp.]TIX28908.1 MAG: hypothetical protein E5V35_00680 [Mesorhizobium sp.]